MPRSPATKRHDCPPGSGTKPCLPSPPLRDSQPGPPPPDASADAGVVVAKTSLPSSVLRLNCANLASVRSRTESPNQATSLTAEGGPRSQDPPPGWVSTACSCVTLALPCLLRDRMPWSDPSVSPSSRTTSLRRLGRPGARENRHAQSSERHPRLVLSADKRKQPLSADSLTCEASCSPPLSASPGRIHSDPPLSAHAILDSPWDTTQTWSTGFCLFPHLVVRYSLSPPYPSPWSGSRYSSILPSSSPTRSCPFLDCAPSCVLVLLELEDTCCSPEHSTVEHANAVTTLPHAACLVWSSSKTRLCMFGRG
mmetsp:Transcript_2372/g.8604  ORF Transcript_2372/g.8604 Transcript_2372/m.8604 type:complete len:310 (-) Transcript_2372:134-1063(-)